MVHKFIKYGNILIIMKTFNKLNVLGFNKYSSNVINVLLSGNIYTVKEIYQKTKIPKNKIYETLEVLISKGIVAEDKGKPKKYFILNDGILNSMIDKKQIQLEELKNKLIEIKKSREKISSSVVSIIEGDDEIHRLIEYSNLSVKKEILSCSRLTKMHYGCYRTLKQAINRGVKVKFIVVYTGKNFEVIKQYYDLGVDIRIYNSKKEVFPRIGLFDKKFTRITIWDPDIKNSENYKTIWAKSSILYRIVRNHFDTIWNSSEPFIPKKFK